MRSVYQDEAFADYWDRVGHDSTGYKRLILNPVMFKAMGPIGGKAVLEVGCGNGVLGPHFLKQGAAQLTLLDISQANLDRAKARVKGRAELVRQDVTKRWKVPSHSVDVVFSRMVLNEIRAIGKVLSEARRVIKPGGIVVIGVVHPALSLCDFLQRKRVRGIHHVEGGRPYFERGYSSFVVSSERHKTFRLPYYHHTFSDYVAAFLGAGLRLEGVFEPEVPARLKRRPQFRSITDRPRSLVVAARKV